MTVTHKSKTADDTQRRQVKSTDFLVESIEISHWIADMWLWLWAGSGLQFWGRASFLAFAKVFQWWAYFVFEIVSSRHWW